MYQPVPSPVYPKAPIIESIIELRTAGEMTPTVLDKIAHRLKRRYPNVEEMREFTIALEATGGNVRMQHEAKGHRLTTGDVSQIAIVAPGKLVTACLPPYPGWETLRAVAAENWSMWRACASEARVTRIGVRFINRIDVSTTTGTISLDEYFTFFPRMEAFGDAPLTAFTIQVSIPSLHDANWSATLTSAPVTPPPVPGYISILLDIDVFRDKDIPLRDDRLWETVDQARLIKNDLFERALTAAAKERFRA